MFSDPEKNVAKLFLRDGMKVADFGAGTGAYAVAAGKRVGETGRVYAVDVQKDLLGNVQTAARDAGLDNVEVLWGDVEEPHGSKLADESVDAVILSNILFQVAEKKGVVREAKRVLKPGGKMLVVDWSDSFGGLGPHMDDVVSSDAAKEILRAEGFSFESEFDAGDHHYGIIVKK